MEASTVEIDGAIQSCTRSCAKAMYGNGSGSIGTLATSSMAVQTATLNNINDIVNYEVGMKIVANDTDNATSVRSGTLTIDAVDRTLGTFHTTANLSTGISAIAQNDYLFVEGDPGAKMKGLSGWLPTTVASTGDLFFAVDRYADRVRLAGWYEDLSAYPIEEALVAGAARVSREGGTTDYAFINFSTWENLVKSLGSKVQYIDVQTTAGVGFRGVEINGPKGAIKVVPDHNCPSTDAFLLQLDTWKLYSLGLVPKILSTDGLKMLRDASADSVEVRVGYYAQIGCVAPGWNARIKVS